MWMVLRRLVAAVVSVVLVLALLAGAAEARKINLKQVRAVAIRTARADCEKMALERLVEKRLYNRCERVVVEPYDCTYGPPVVKVSVAACDGKWILDTPFVDSALRLVCWWSPKRARFYQAKSGAIRAHGGRTSRCTVIAVDGTPA